MPPATPVVEPSSRLATINVALNVRSGPGADFASLGVLAAASQVTIIGQSDDGTWWQIDYENSEAGRGWVAAEFVTLAATPTPVLPPTNAQISLSLQPPIIHRTECARLRYEIVDLLDVTLNDTPLAITSAGGNSLAVCPTSDAEYTLAGRDTAGRVISQSVRLTVLPSTPTPPSQGGAMLVGPTAGCQLALATLGTRSEQNCRFAPDGSQIAVPAGDGRVWLVSVDGKQVRQLFDPTGRFALTGNLLWSPDGSRLAFEAQSQIGQGRGVGVIRLVDGAVTYLGPEAGQAEAEAKVTNPLTQPRWTDDGRLLITWFVQGPDLPGAVAFFPLNGEARPTLLQPDTEVQLSASAAGQQLFPWKPGRIWYQGRVPAYEMD
jgi:hypothetical protein